ncbi:hypothetical protein ECG_02380 [Echinococcus granulosus]|nr:hypothetical protein ECG_02380 [Echinococcus granulosus]
MPWRILVHIREALDPPERNGLNRTRISVDEDSETGLQYRFQRHLMCGWMERVNARISDENECIWTEEGVRWNDLGDGMEELPWLLQLFCCSWNLMVKKFWFKLISILIVLVKINSGFS